MRKHDAERLGIPKIPLPGEKPPVNPATASGHFFTSPTSKRMGHPVSPNAAVRGWKRADGTDECRVQAYMSQDLARRLRAFCQERNITLGSFLERATINLLNELGGGI